MGPILHPTDFSAASRPAFAVAVDFARRYGAPLMLVHVVNPMLPMITMVSPPTYEALRTASVAWAERRLARMARGVRVPVTALVLEGKEAEVIARVARRRRASYVVMGTHGRSGFTGLVLGSVAARVLAIAPCPVLTVPARRPRSTRGRRPPSRPSRQHAGRRADA
jgi:nucleotide-binding universal stress UspA family protein